jgi:hypothetical protein
MKIGQQKGNYRLIPCVLYLYVLRSGAMGKKMITRAFGLILKGVNNAKKSLLWNLKTTDSVLITAFII